MWQADKAFRQWRYRGKRSYFQQLIPTTNLKPMCYCNALARFLQCWVVWGALANLTVECGCGCTCFYQR